MGHILNVKKNHAVLWPTFRSSMFCFSYFKFDDRYRRKYSDYPKPKAAPWLGCGTTTPK